MSTIVARVSQPQTAFGSFRMTRQDMPKDLFRSGSSDGCVSLILERFLTRVKLNGTENVPRDTAE